MRRGFMLAALVLPLAGCYAQSEGSYGYGYGGYQQPGYQAAPYGYQDEVYPGYAYNGGAPSMMYEGSQRPLLFWGGFWGYNDRYGSFHRAPDGVQRHLESRHPRDSGARAFGGQSVAPHFGGGLPRLEQRQAPIAPAAAPAVAAPAPRAAAPGPRQEEHRGGDRRCPTGQLRC